MSQRVSHTETALRALQRRLPVEYPCVMRKKIYLPIKSGGMRAGSATDAFSGISIGTGTGRSPDVNHTRTGRAHTIVSVAIHMRAWALLTTRARRVTKSEARRRQRVASLADRRIERPRRRAHVDIVGSTAQKNHPKRSVPVESGPLRVNVPGGERTASGEPSGGERTASGEPSGGEEVLPSIPCPPPRRGFPRKEFVTRIGQVRRDLRNLGIGQFCSCFVLK
jgi:hypothetical protein